MERQTLPVELLDGIFTQLYENNPSNLLPLTLVSRGIYMLVIPLIYRSVTIDISNEGSVREENVYETLVQRLLAGPSVCVLVKELSVVKQGAYVNPHLRNSELLASLIPRLVRLEVFRWEIKDSFPEGLDQSLLWKASDSRFRLHLDIGFKYEVDDLRIHHKFLGQACHTLSTLRIYIPSGYYAPTDNRRVKSRLFSALKDCTNLRILSIYGHDRRIRSINGPWLVVEPGESLPSLRDLSVTDNSDTLRREDLEIWGANGRWSNLQKVTFRDPQLLDGIHGCEKTLISINLLEVSESFQTPLTDICSRLDHLRELRVGGKHLCIPVLALKKCGHSLKSLVMRGHDEYCQELANKVPLESLQLVHDYCPVLSKMDMSIDWPSGGLNYLSMLAQFSHLTELTLHFDRHPVYNGMSLVENDKAYMATTEHLFRHLIKHSHSQQLESLTVYYSPQLSDWDDPQDYKDTLETTIFQASSTTADGQEREISVYQIQAKVKIGANVSQTSSKYRIGQKEIEATIDYLNSMPPVILSRMISASGGQPDRASSELPNLDYDIRTGGLQSQLASYEADWKASNSILPLLEWQLQKRKEQGWELWEMWLMQGKAGKEGFLYNRLQANKENGKTGDIEGRKERLSTESGNTVLGCSKTIQRPRARSM